MSGAGQLGSEVIGLISPGTEVQIEGLVAAAHLNGMRAVVIEYDNDAQRYRVHAENDSNVALKPGNFRLLGPGSSTPTPAVVAAAQDSDADAQTRLAVQNTTTTATGSSESLEINVVGDTASGGNNNRASRLQRIDTEDTLWYKMGCVDGVLCEAFPYFLRTATFGAGWLFLITMLLIYAPR
eukprot:g9412.t1